MIGVSRPGIRKLVNGLLLVGTAWFVGRYFYDKLDSVLAYAGEWNLGWFLASTTVLLVVYVVQALTWRAILLKSDAHITVFQACYVYFFGMIASYIPGRVWGPIGMVTSASERGVPAARSLATTVFSTGISLLAATVVSLLIMSGSDRGLFVSILWTAPFLIAGSFLFFPELAVKIINRILTILGKSPIYSTLRGRDVPGFFGWYLFTWVLYGLALVFFAFALGNSKIDSIPTVIGANAAAYVAGYAAFFTPAGLGVREIVLAETLRQLANIEQVISLSLFSRLWLLGSQLLGFLISGLAMWTHKRMEGNTG